MGTPSLWYRFREWLSVLLFPDFWEWYSNMAKRNWELEEENEELETQLSLSISMYEGDRSPMHKLEEENAALKRENEVLADFKDEVEAVSDLMYQYTMRRLTEQEPE